MPDIQIPIPTGSTAPESDAPSVDESTAPATESTDPDTFDRAYVEKLRKESAGYRERAGRADEAGRRLLDATVRAHAGAVLADPGDLLHFGSPAELLGEDGYPDPAKVTAAAEALVTARPHLATRRVTGDAGQGPRGTVSTAPDLAQILRRAAG